MDKNPSSPQRPGGVQDWAKQLGIIERHPFTGIACRKGNRGRPVTRAEFQAMLRNTKPVFRRLLIFLRYTGCRPCEAVGTEWTHLDISKLCITLTRHKTAKKTGRVRRLVLHPVVVKLLAWIAQHRPHPRFVFINSKRTKWKNPAISWRMKRIRAAADIGNDVKAYGCRHAFATNAALSGVDVSILADLIGHADIRQTQTYLHLAGRIDHLQRAVSTILVNQ